MSIQEVSNNEGIRMKPVFSPTLCLTHDCNLSCEYCYQTHDTGNRMSFETAKNCIDWIFSNIPSDMEGVEIGLIGGEPLLEFELIKAIIKYTQEKYSAESFIFSAATNGTLLTEEMKTWLTSNKDIFVLGLSLDGLPETHNRNRCNSYSDIDIDFFIRTYPDAGVKMTLTEYSLEHLAENIKYIHSLGFKNVGGVNLFEGDFDWSDDKYIRILIPQLEALVAYYVENDTLIPDQMMNRMLEACEINKGKAKKWCGIGTGAIFFDVDGKMYPCPFVTPMTFDPVILQRIWDTDYTDELAFVDEKCLNECYIFPICPHCSGANLLEKSTFKYWDKSKCRIQKLVTVFCAELQAQRIIKNPAYYLDDQKYYMITAIQNIRETILPEFKTFLND